MSLPPDNEQRLLQQPERGSCSKSLPLAAGSFTAAGSTGLVIEILKYTDKLATTPIESAVPRLVGVLAVVVLSGLAYGGGKLLQRKISSRESSNGESGPIA